MKLLYQKYQMVNAHVLFQKTNYFLLKTLKDFDMFGYIPDKYYAMAIQAL